MDMNKINHMRALQQQEFEMPEQDYGDLAPDMAPQVMMKPHQDPDLVRWQIDGSDLLEVLEHNLKREYFDRDNAVWRTRPNERPMMNDMGVYDILSVLQPRLHKVVSLTNLTENDVKRMALDIRRDVITKLYLNYDLYEVQKSDMTTIVQMVDQLAYAVLRKSYNDGQRRHLSETTQFNRNETTVNRGDQGSPSFASKMSRFFGG
tara:strand:+ start:189 stop:803 length:615 start_codon:yes stop_codon:yes gene_type:complete